MQTSPDPVFGCELVLTGLNADGYARAGRQLAHVVVFEKKHGALPDDLFVDHLCRRRNCVALHHLEAVPQGENERRKLWRYRARRTTCPVGHPYPINAVVTPEGGRVCRTCNRAAKGSS